MPNIIGNRIYYNKASVDHCLIISRIDLTLNIQFVLRSEYLQLDLNRQHSLTCFQIEKLSQIYFKFPFLIGSIKYFTFSYRIFGFALPVARQAFQNGKKM